MKTIFYGSLKWIIPFNSYVGFVEGIEVFEPLYVKGSEPLFINKSNG